MVGAEGDGGSTVITYIQAPEGVAGLQWGRELKGRTFCFLRLQLSHALAVRCLLSGSTLARVMLIMWRRLIRYGRCLEAYRFMSFSAPI